MFGVICSSPLVILPRSPTWTHIYPLLLSAAAASDVCVEAIFVPGPPGHRGVLDSAKKISINSVDAKQRSVAVIINSADATATLPSDVAAIRRMIQQLYGAKFPPARPPARP